MCKALRAAKLVNCRCGIVVLCCTVPPAVEIGGYMHTAGVCTQQCEVSGKPFFRERQFEVKSVVLVPWRGFMSFGSWLAHLNY